MIQNCFKDFRECRSVYDKFVLDAEHAVEQSGLYQIYLLLSADNVI